MSNASIGGSHNYIRTTTAEHRELKVGTNSTNLNSSTQRHPDTRSIGLELPIGIRLTQTITTELPYRARDLLQWR